MGDLALVADGEVGLFVEMELELLNDGFALNDVEQCSSFLIRKLVGRSVPTPRGKDC